MLLIYNYIVWSIFPFIIHQTLALSFNQPKIGADAKWCENGITFVNESILGGHARGFFIDRNDTIYVAAYAKSQILVWLKESSFLIRSLHVDLFSHTTLFVTSNGDIYFENGNEGGRIDKWTINSNTSTHVTTFSDHCLGLFVDINNTLYCSQAGTNRIIKKSLNDKNATEVIVAGIDPVKAESDVLRQPWGIYVDIHFKLYVADAQNSEIKVFHLGNSTGELVAGKGIPHGLSLNFPTDVVLDADGLLYIADTHHSRVIRLEQDRQQCIIGCSSKGGSAPNDFQNAYSLRFDSLGNLYVADEGNNRIQKFILSTNSCAPCGSARDFGPYCNISKTMCDMINHCENNGTCTSTNKSRYGFNCSCKPDFSGLRCEIDNRLCKPTTCWNNGTCRDIANSSSPCNCVDGWEGFYCERRVNYCQNVTCYNRGVCFSSSDDYICHCLGDNYYTGRHCETKSNRIIFLQTFSRSCSYIAILVMISAVMFIIIMDILKYYFGIDPVRKDLEKIRRKKRAKKRKPVIQRFIYVHAPSESPNSIVTQA